MSKSMSVQCAPNLRWTAETMREDRRTANTGPHPVHGTSPECRRRRGTQARSHPSLLTEVCGRDRRQRRDDNCSDFATAIDDHKPVLEWRNARNVGRLSSGAIGIDEVGAAHRTSSNAVGLSVRDAFCCERALSVVRDHRNRGELLGRSGTEAAGASTDQAVVASKCAGTARPTACVILCGNGRWGTGSQRDSEDGRYGWIRLSPDGQRLALTNHESGIASISVLDLKTKDTIRVTSRPGEYTGLTWLPDGNLAFGGATGLGWVQPTGVAESASLADRRPVAQTPWSADSGGRRLAYYERSPETGFDVWTAPVVSGDRGPRLGPREPFLRTRAFEVYPSFSPDGRWIAYASNESGAWEIYVRRFPDNGTKVRVSMSGGVVPYWSPNGRELIYRTDANQVMVLTYKVVGDSFTADNLRPWSQHTLADTGVLPNFAVDSTGERILALIAAPEKDPQTANHVTVIVNFDESVRRAASR